MKEALVLCVIAALLPGLHGLLCAQCQLGNASCTTCDEKDQICIAIQEVAPTVKPSDNRMYKDCIASAQCTPLSVSLSTFSDRHFQSTTACCDSDQCNTNLRIADLPTGDFKNGVNCPMCEKTNGPHCEKSGYLACTGLEEKCIALVGSSLDDKGKNFSLKGCASRNACSMRVNDTFAFNGVVYTLDANATCSDRGTPSALSTPATLLLPAIVGYLAVNVLPDL